MESQLDDDRRPLLTPEDTENLPVYPIIHMIRSVHTPLTYEALTAPDLAYTLVRPLAEKYIDIQNGGNMSVVFCFLLNRVHFIRDDDVMSAAVNRSRAELCEILAIQTFRVYGNNMLHLTLTLTTSWPVYSGADPNLLYLAREERDGDLEDRVGNAIELAIVGKAKRFIKSSACQKVINGIWSGKCVYQADSNHSILSDTYKRTPVHFYDPHRAPLLDHYRLKVPAIRSVLEYLNFLALFVSINFAEAIFMIYALGFSLEKIAAMQEHGIKGSLFVTTYCIYAILRLYGVHHHKGWARVLGIDFLALIACLILAFVTFKNSLMVLSLRAMMMQFVFLMLVAAFCFCGFLYALWTLSRNQAGTIGWWMLDLWFGLDASGFQNATQFHPILGPILMVTYACLSNTLLLTVLILSNTFARINEDAAAEAMFRKAVSTIEGVKADSLFSYQPPVNLVALCIMLPASYILTPRWFHKVLTSFPILLFIALYERQSKTAGTASFSETVGHMAEKVFDLLPRSIKRMCTLAFFEGLAGSDADIDAIFELGDQCDSALDVVEDNQSLPGKASRRSSVSSARRRVSNGSQEAPPRPILRPRINSSVSRVDSFASPLAQVFQPLMVDEDIPEETEDSQPGPSGISYGPASRRRLLSLQTNQRRPHEISNSAWGIAGARHQTATHSTIDTLSEAGIQDAYTSVDLKMRLDDIEKRQERIESLLTRIASSLQVGS
ncbi:hypothetical protein BDQ17DRAFT_1389716 [Cyathus striatus]|nr:hypothetical protein BDQ17DRAFT_1389716 [Cyathus striatus]